MPRLTWLLDTEMGSSREMSGGGGGGGGPLFSCPVGLGNSCRVAKITVNKAQLTTWHWKVPLHSSLCFSAPDIAELVPTKENCHLFTLAVMLYSNFSNVYGVKPGKGQFSSFPQPPPPVAEQLLRITTSCGHH